jgi:hypothetical protein
MAKINDYYQKKQLIEKLVDELSKLEEDQSLKDELAFEAKVKSLMSDHSKDPRDVLQILSVIDPSLSISAQPGIAQTRTKRPIKVYTNPHTNEVVETRGGNHKTLNEWRKQWGKNEVQSWSE